MEAQAQLSYQTTKYQSFQNSASRFKAYDADTLRTRLGLNLAQTLKTAQDKTLKTYGFLHTIQNLQSSTPVNIGDVKVKEEFTKSYGEIGVGIQGHINKSTFVFGDVRYQHSFSNGNGTREGGAVNLGVKVQF